MEVYVMERKVTKLENCHTEVLVTVDEKTWKDAQKKAKKDTEKKAKEATGKAVRGGLKKIGL